MPILVPCPLCQRQLRVPEAAAGKRVRCPQCQATVAVPAPAVAAPPPLPEAVKPAAPPPLPVAGIQAELPAAVVASAADVVEAQPVPATRRRRFPPVCFPVTVFADPDKALKGILQAELSPGGLSLTQGKKHDYDLPVGTRSRYLGANRFVVELDEREVTLAVTAPRKYQHRLARDAAAFLRGEKEVLRDADYNLPWGLYAAALLPFCVTILAVVWRAAFNAPAWGAWGVWSGIWGGVGGGLTAGAVAVVQRERWPLAARLGGVLGLTALGCIGFFLTVGLTSGLGTPRIDPRVWGEFRPPGGGFRIEMPGNPVAKPLAGPPGMQDIFTAYGVEVNKGAAAFMIAYGDIPPNEVNRIPLEERFVGARQGMLAHAPGAQLVSERPLTIKTWPGREFVLDVPRQGMVVVHTYLVKNRLFMLLAGGRGYQPTSPDVQRFLVSFQLADPPPLVQLPAPPPAGVPPASALPGLLGYWPIERRQDGKVADASGSGHDANVSGGSIVAGVRNLGLHLNGMGDHLDYSSSPHFNFTANSSFTISCWCQTILDGPVVSQRNLEDPAPVIDLTIENGRLTAVVRADRIERGEAKVVGGFVRDGSWHHVALTRSPAGRIELFLDGQTQGQAVGGNSGGAITTNLRAAGAELYWARVRRFGTPFLTGTIAELAIYGRTLTNDEVRRLAGR